MAYKRKETKPPRIVAGKRVPRERVSKPMFNKIMRLRAEGFKDKEIRNMLSDDHETVDITRALLACNSVLAINKDFVHETAMAVRAGINVLATESLDMYYELKEAGEYETAIKYLKIYLDTARLNKSMLPELHIIEQEDNLDAVYAKFEAFIDVTDSSKAMEDSTDETEDIDQ